jgi:hypothetical protein
MADHTDSTIVALMRRFSPRYSPGGVGIWAAVNIRGVRNLALGQCRATRAATGSRSQPRSIASTAAPAIFSPNRVEFADAVGLGR